jgi:hypothetical protein
LRCELRKLVGAGAFHAVPKITGPDGADTGQQPAHRRRYAAVKCQPGCQADRQRSQARGHQEDDPPGSQIGDLGIGLGYFPLLVGHGLGKCFRDLTLEPLFDQLMELARRFVGSGLPHRDDPVDEGIDSRETCLELSGPLPLFELAIVLLVMKKRRLLLDLPDEPPQRFLNLPARQIEFAGASAAIDERVADGGLVVKRLHREHCFRLTLFIGEFGTPQLIVEALRHHHGHGNDGEDQREIERLRNQEFQAHIHGELRATAIATGPASNIAAANHAALLMPDCGRQRRNRQLLPRCVPLPGNNLFLMRF